MDNSDQLRGLGQDFEARVFYSRGRDSFGAALPFAEPRWLAGALPRRALSTTSDPVDSCLMTPSAVGETYSRSCVAATGWGARSMKTSCDQLPATCAEVGGKNFG